MANPPPNALFSLNPAGRFVAMRDGSSSSKFLNATGSTGVKTGAGLFKGVVCCKAAASSTVTVYDGVDNTGTLLGTFDTSAMGSFNGLNINVTTGIYVVIAGGSPNVIVLYV